uniref:hypothetical protein n=1 Tax=Nitrospira cf. moscoviensis SBR1015 TaxID=96242 RepID=UPI00111F946D|nr:hypothetical protein [Nitrospira cf. moscoviensis SBR1015]
MVKLKRPTTAQPLLWDASGALRVTIVFSVDGVEHRCVGQASGGIRQDSRGEELTEYSLKYHPTVSFGGRARQFIASAVKDAEGYYRGVPLTRAGESGAVVEGYLLLERLGGDVNTVITVATSEEAPAPVLDKYKNSVAFEAATDASEVGGDGVISLTHTAAGPDRLAFATNGGMFGSSAAGTSSITYGGAGMSEKFDLNFNVFGGTYIFVSGYTLVAPATGAQTVTATSTGSTFSFNRLAVHSYTGVDQTTPTGTAATNSGIGAGASVTVPGTPGAGSMIVDAHVPYSLTPTVGPNQTERTREFGLFDSTLVTSTQSGADGAVMSWTHTVDDAPNGWVIGAIELLESAGGAPFASNLMLLGVGK